LSPLELALVILIWVLPQTEVRVGDDIL